MLVMLSRLDFRRFHRNRSVSNGSNGAHRTAFPPFQRISKYSLHFQFHLMTRLPLTQLDLHFWFHLITRLPLTQMDFRFHFMTRLRWTPGFFHWNLVESIGHV